MQGIYNYIPEYNPVSKDTLMLLFVFAICATSNVISPVKFIIIIIIIIIIICERNSTSTEFNGPMFILLFCFSSYPCHTDFLCCAAF